MPIPAGYEGYAAFGDVLGGGATTRANVRGQQYLGAASDTAYKFNRASEERAKAIIQQSMLDHRQALDTALPGVYTDPAQARLASAVLGSNSAVNMGSLGKFQTPGYPALVAEQQAALAKGDFKRSNAITAVLGDKQFEPVLVRGGSYIENGATLGDLDAVPTPTALATIERQQAATQQGQQRTDAYVDKSNRPPAERGGKPFHMPLPELKFHAERVERELHRKLTESELQDLATGHFTMPAKGHGHGAAAHDAPMHPRVPTGAVEALRKNPGLRGEFAAKYGDEAARVALGR